MKKKRQTGAAVSPTLQATALVVSPVQAAVTGCSQAPVPMAEPEGGDGSVPMDIEGTGRPLPECGQNSLYLQKEIRIGRDSGCDIVFNDPSLMPVQARIIETVMNSLSRTSVIRQM